MKLSQRILGINPSATLAVEAKAKELIAGGKEIISLGAGEPDFVSPPAVLSHARQAIDRGDTHYTHVAGIVQLREEICAYYTRRFGLTFAPNQVIIGAGAKQSLYETMAAILDPGDEVVVFAPTWVSYLEQIRLMNGHVVVVDTEKTGFSISEEALRAALTDKTVALLVNSPANPTGVVYDAGTIAMLGRIAEELDLWLIWDEIYEQLTYEGAEHVNPLQIMPEMAERTFIINGMSKTYAMTGWRIGYVIAPAAAAAKICNYQSHLNSNPCSIAQWAALGALLEASEDVVRMRQAFQKRRNLICDLLRQMPELNFPKPEGAFYVFVDIRQYLGKTYKGQGLVDDVTFCSVLLENALVALVPGSAFLSPGYVRISYATSEENIREGMKRLDGFLRHIS